MEQIPKEAPATAPLVPHRKLMFAMLPTEDNTPAKSFF
jgi:hypothetical protein